MFTHPPCASKALPGEYRTTADKLFPPGGEGKGPSTEAVQAFADALGIGADFRRLWQNRKTARGAGDFLDSFQSNLDLLIQKTWVDKAEESRKEKLQDQVPPLVSLIESGNYAEALEEFGVILEELAHLFFSVQSQKDDFAEYVLRIDTQMGLFWWYGGQIKYARDAAWVKTADRSALHALLLLGICYLTNF